MAVVRQNTQIFNQPIGVVRADAGASELGAAISRAAASASEMIYREGAIQAEEVGKKAGVAQPASKIIAINPTTGLPEAYAAPAGFGRIASRSYQNMIDRRFEDSVVDEIKMRGQEIASDARSSDEFRTRMTSYVEQMYANAVDQGGELNAYGRLIEEAGTAYVSSTYTALRNQEIAAAKKAVEEAQKYSLFMTGRETSAAIRAGVSPEEAAVLLQSQFDRVQDLYASGAITFSSFKSEVENIDGLASISANNQLAQIYGGMSDFQKAKFKMSLQDPQMLDALGQEIGVPGLPGLALSSLATTSVASLTTALDSFATIQGEYQENLADSLVADFPVSVFTSNADIIAYGSQIQDTAVREEVISDLTATMILTKADRSIDEVENLDALSNELLKYSGMNRSVIEGVLGSDAADAIFAMDPKQRAALEDQLSNRRASLDRVGTAEMKAVSNALGEMIRDVSASSDPTADMASLKQQIDQSSLSAAEKNRLDGVLTGTAAERLRSLADNIDPGSVADFEGVVTAVKSGNPSGLRADQRALYETYRSALELQGDTTSSVMGRRLEGMKQAATRMVESAELTSIQASIDQGRALTPDQLELADKTLLRNVRTVADLSTNRDALRIMASGAFTPKMNALFASAIGSTDENTVATATQLFEQFSRISGRTSFGELVEVDVMRSNIDAKAYAAYAAASYAGRKLNTSPAAALNGIRNYEGGIAGIDAAIKARLDVAQSKPLSAVLDEYSMSPNYKAEILSMLRVMEALGQNVDADTIDGWISDYEQSSVRDDSIVGFKVGDQTIYGLRNYLSNQEILDHRNELTDLMAQDDRLKALLKGGTVTDAMISGALEALFPSILTQGEAVTQLFRKGWDASAEMNDEARLRAGLSALNIELKYKPNPAAFAAGVPSWFVGYEQGGMFQMIELNDEPYILEKRPDSVESQTAATYNQLIVATNSGADNADIARATIQYWATLPHMTEGWLLANPAELQRINRMLPEQNALELLKAAREGNE